MTPTGRSCGCFLPSDAARFQGVVRSTLVFFGGVHPLYIRISQQQWTWSVSSSFRKPEDVGAILELITMKTLLSRVVLLCCCATSLMGVSREFRSDHLPDRRREFPPAGPESLGAPADSVQFVQLSWDEVRELPFGSSDHIEVSPRFHPPPVFPQRSELHLARQRRRWHHQGMDGTRTGFSAAKRNGDDVGWGP